MSRWPIILLLLTTLLLPALCATGWLLHACDCDASISCAHETECDSDPCEIGLARTDTRPQDWTGADLHGTPTPDPTADTPCEVSGRIVSIEDAPKVHAGRPYPASDLPLLI